jgi:4-carboxymuconolactone decarboxylase
MKFTIVVVAACIMFSVVGSVAAQDRLPRIPEDKMTDAQKKAVAQVSAARGGNMPAPFNPVMRDPEFLSAQEKLGTHLRYLTAPSESPLGQKLNELVIVMAARRWTQQTEFQSHYAAALKFGMKAEVLEAINEGRRPVGMPEDEQIVYDFCTELHQNQSVSDTTYAQAVKKFGEKGVVDMVGLTGYYVMISMLTSVARTPPPQVIQYPLIRFPH